MTLSLFHRNRYLLPLIAAAFAAFSLFCVADCMRETDQASVLIGAWQLFHGSPVAGEAYYNYDKLYQTYWLTAVALWLRSHWGGAWSPVLIGNLASAAVFWACTLLASFVIGVRRRFTAVCALICLLSTPAVLINSVYTNPAVLSAGFLLVCGALLLTGRTLARRALAAFFFFLAVGARGDAVLLAPLLVWLDLPTRGWMRAMWTGTTTWLLGAAAVAAALLGRFLYTGKPLYYDPVFLGSKVFAGYLLFGLAGSLGLLVVLCLLLASRAAVAGRPERKLFFLAGVVALLVPLGYYSLQLWSPRYLVTTAVGVCLLSWSRHGQALLSLRPVRPVFQGFYAAATAMAVLLLFVGLHFESLRQPQLTVHDPTLFPTADGLHPMGAYGSFLLSLRHVSDREVDHNQVAWKAAREAKYVPDADGIVHVLDTPMQAYLRLGATLQGLRSRVELVANRYDLHGQLYSESRTFMRLGSDQADPGLVRLLMRPAKIVSPVYEGIAVLRFAPDGDPGWGVRTRMLDALFRGDEYRLYSPSSPRLETVRDKRPFALVAAEPFAVSIGGQVARANLDQGSGLYYVRGSAHWFGRYRVFPGEPGDLTLAVQTLPSWMSVRNRK